jgi:hypothetical protein
MRGLRTLKKRLDKAAGPEKAKLKGLARTGSKAGVTR